jgi:membrane-associated phospholipid phosphatase
MTRFLDMMRTGVTAACGALAVGSLLLAGGARADADMAASVGATKFWEDGASVHWNRRNLELFRARGGNPGRGLAYLSIAQYRAVLAAQAARGATRPSEAGAAAGASVHVLKAFYPLDANALEAELAAQAADGWPGQQQRDFDAGVAIGRAVGAAVLAQAATDNFGGQPPGTPPVGAGYWIPAPAPAPIIRGGLGGRPFFLDYGGELLSPPPPAFGSPEFQAALAVVRGISDTRTLEQVAIARKWVPFSHLLFNATATDLIVKYRKRELEAARILAYANAASFDAIIACFYTKYHYWFLRPTQADPAITMAVGLPNHPSYPSAHSCETGAFEAVLGDAFPSERPMLAEMAAEANASRIYAGLHYPFDGAAGLEIGRQAGRLALERGGL